MLKFWSKVAEELDANYKVFLALVVGHQKGTPGTARAVLLYTEGGEQMGTIGGGAMEASLLESAIIALKKDIPEPQLKTLFHRDTEDGSASGLICGGAQTQLTMVLDQRHRPVVHLVLDRLVKDQAGSLVISPFEFILREEDLNKPFIELSEEGEAWTVRFGLFNRKRILIAGCGHCGAALARQMVILGFHVTVIEPREDLFTLQQLPGSVVRRSLDYREAGSGIEHARLTFAIVMTPSYPDDIDALSSLLPLPFSFIGVMGSHSKLKKIHDALLNRGFTESDWDRIQAPVGIPIDSDTPEEIAVSVAAKILQTT